MMVDEAFALSPISARAAQPGEADYAAISEAFMETARGRWFLGEYAKRNRNADTSMVLNAVARIEENLAEQNQALSQSGLTEAMASIRRSVDEARTAALQAIDGRAFAESVGPIRKGSRVIREIAWRLREIGADGRICDLIVSQIDAIDAASAKIAAIDSAEALDAAFNLIEQRIESFGRDEAIAPASADDATANPKVDDEQATKEFPSAATMAQTSDIPASNAPPAAEVTSVAPESAAPDSKIAVIAQQVPVAEPENATQLSSTPQSVVMFPPAEVTPGEADLIHDDAVLERVAMEMGAAEPLESVVTEDFSLKPPTPKNENNESAPTPPSLSQPTPPAEPSLGESLLANGIVRRPIPSISDPFAAIRRLSQVEKIAFFS